MDFSPTEDQAALLDGLDAILVRHSDIPTGGRNAHHVYDEALRGELQSAGFLDVGRMDDMGPLEAAMVAERIARLPATLETSATLLVAPLLGIEMDGPLALISAPIAAAHRNLPIARLALIDTGEGAMRLLTSDPADVERVETIFAYPYGRFRKTPDLSGAGTLDTRTSAEARRGWRLAIAAEAVGAMRSAIDFTLEHVKERRIFGRPLASFQALQHRLAECHQIQRAAWHLLMKAAWSGTACDALLAATYVQGHTQKLMFDLHQFNGAMGLTNEHLLHFWTYRLRALQPELGGANAAALEAADTLWPRRTTQVDALLIAPAA